MQGMSLPNWGIATCPLLSVLPECIYQIVEMQISRSVGAFFSTNEGYITLQVAPQSRDTAHKEVARVHKALWRASEQSRPSS